MPPQSFVTLENSMKEQITWWGDRSKIEASLQRLQAFPAPWLAVEWKGYGGNDGVIEIAGMNVAPLTVVDVANALGMDPLKAANLAQEGYVQYIQKEALVELLTPQVQNPDGDPEPFQASDNFQDLEELDDYNDLYQQAQDEDEDNDDYEYEQEMEASKTADSVDEIGQANTAVDGNLISMADTQPATTAPKNATAKSASLDLRQVAEQAVTIFKEHAEQADVDAEFDAGEFSGPASARMAERAVAELAEANGFHYDQVMDELNRMENEEYDPSQDVNPAGVSHDWRDQTPNDLKHGSTDVDNPVCICGRKFYDHDEQGRIYDDKENQLCSGFTPKDGPVEPVKIGAAPTMNDDAFECEYCDATFGGDDNEDYKVHLDKVHPDKAPSLDFTCPDCQKKLTQPLLRQKVYRHLLGHGLPEDEAKTEAMKFPAARGKKADLNWDPEKQEYEKGNVCPACGGSGVKTVPAEFADQTTHGAAKCRACAGTGKKLGEASGVNTCPGCGGTNYMINGKEIVCPTCNKTYPVDQLVWKGASAKTGATEGQLEEIFDHFEYLLNRLVEEGRATEDNAFQILETEEDKQAGFVRQTVEEMHLPEETVKSALQAWIGKTAAAKTAGPVVEFPSQPTVPQAIQDEEDLDERTLARLKTLTPEQILDAIKSGLDEATALQFQENLVAKVGKTAVTEFKDLPVRYGSKIKVKEDDGSIRDGIVGGVVNRNGRMLVQYYWEGGDYNCRPEQVIAVDGRKIAALNPGYGSNLTLDLMDAIAVIDGVVNKLNSGAPPAVSVMELKRLRLKLNNKVQEMGKVSARRDPYQRMVQGPVQLRRLAFEMVVNDGMSKEDAMKVFSQACDWALSQEAQSLLGGSHEAAGKDLHIPSPSEARRALMTEDAEDDDTQLTVILHGSTILYSKAELQEMLDDPKLYEQADNLPVWVQRSLLGTEAVPKVPRERGGEYSNKAFGRAYQLALQKIKGWMDAPKPVTIKITERYPANHPATQELGWTRNLVEGADEEEGSYEAFSKNKDEEGSYEAFTPKDNSPKEQERVRENRKQELAGQLYSLKIGFNEGDLDEIINYQDGPQTSADWDKLSEWAQMCIGRLAKAQPSSRQASRRGRIAAEGNMTTPTTPADIAQRLIRTMEADNGHRKGDMLGRLITKKAQEFLGQLEHGIATMIANGMVFDEEAMETIAAGDQDAAEENYSKFVGYEEMNRALNNIFDPQREWIRTSK